MKIPGLRSRCQPKGGATGRAADRLTPRRALLRVYTWGPGLFLGGTRSSRGDRREERWIGDLLQLNRRRLARTAAIGEHLRRRISR